MALLVTISSYNTDSSFKSRVLSSLVVPSFSWWALRGFLFENPLNNPPRIQGQAPKDPQKATRLCHQKGIDGGMFFLPLRWTERIDSCRANAMVVPTGWYGI